MLFSNINFQQEPGLWNQTVSAQIPALLPTSSLILGKKFNFLDPQFSLYKVGKMKWLYLIHGVGVKIKWELIF